VRLALLGFGNVGRALARLLHDRSAALPFRVTAIVTARHGWWVDPRGLELAQVLRLEELPSRGPRPTVGSLPADALVELTTLDPRTGQPAADHMLEAFRAGMHVVTANKGPIALHLADLRAAAFASARELRFEATVSDCLPVFDLARAALPHAEIHAIRGIVSSTTNHILSSAARGIAFADALAEAQRLGIAEADPTNDLEGWDAAVKATILANVLMDADIRPADVMRETISEATGLEAMRVAREGGRVRPLIEIHARPRRTHAHHLEPTEVKASFGPRHLDALDPLYAVDGWSMALELDTDLAGRIVVQLHAPHVEQVAYAVLTDLLDIASAPRSRSRRTDRP
jgi:homoserine dehydrogenase